MKKVIVLLALILNLFAGAASAAYLPEGDKTLSIQTGPVVLEHFPLSEETAQWMFEKQENVHERITEHTGLSIDHSYIWIEINGVKVLAVDPPAVW